MQPSNEEIYEPYYQYAHRLSPKDVGKKIVKVKPSVFDRSYMGKKYTLKSLEYLKYSKCNYCGYDAELICGRCRHNFYCSKSCQNKDWLCHKRFCDNLITKGPVQKIAFVILVDKYGEEHTIDATDWPTGQLRFDDWVVCDDIRNNMAIRIPTKKNESLAVFFSEI